MNTKAGIGIVIFPTDWRLGVIRDRPGKFVFSIGPVRFCYHVVAA